MLRLIADTATGLAETTDDAIRTPIEVKMKAVTGRISEIQKQLATFKNSPYAGNFFQDVFDMCGARCTGHAA